MSTGLEPGVGGMRMTSAVSTAFPARGKAAKAAERSLGRRVTGLKPGADEKEREFRKRDKAFQHFCKAKESGGDAEWFMKVLTELN